MGEVWGWGEAGLGEGGCLECGRGSEGGLGGQEGDSWGVGGGLGVQRGSLGVAGGLGVGRGLRVGLWTPAGVWVAGKEASGPQGKVSDTPGACDWHGGQRSVWSLVAGQT